MTTYTVLGVYADNDFQRYADTFDARTPEDAEQAAIDQAGADLIIAGVLEGDFHTVDLGGESEIVSVAGINPRCDICDEAQQPDDDWNGDTGNHRDCERDKAARCASCGDRLYGLFRAHHHAEDGHDVTQPQPDGKPWKLARCRCTPAHQDGAACPSYYGPKAAIR